MIFLFTDYGLDGPYIGQVETVLNQLAPNEKVINLMADAPRNNPKASAYLLASLIHKIPVGSILFCVVDPRVGSNEDNPVILKINDRWFVGPNNGLFDLVVRQGNISECWKIIWRPDVLSMSFHGRDIYAPVCAMIANKEIMPGEQIEWQDQHQWPDDLCEIIYVDHFGNCMTGIRAKTFGKQRILKINGQELPNENTFSDVLPGQVFWYENSNGLVEIAVNQGSAKQTFQLEVGSRTQNS